MKTVIRGGRIIDPANKIDRVADLLIEDGKIAGLLEPGQDAPGADEIDANGCVVSPGFIDLHVHLREPGFEQKESIRTGTVAAVAGGFTSVVCMANTNPVNDSKATTRFILSQARRKASCRVYPVGAATVGQKGESLTEMGIMKESGVVAISDDGIPIQSSDVSRRVFEYATMFELPVLVHAEDKDIAGNGAMNAGVVSMELGLSGSHKMAEEIHIARDVILAKHTKAHLHVQHVSTGDGMEFIRYAKNRGIKVTCEVTPHHFSLTDADVGWYDSYYKMSPPLRSEADREAMIQALSDGTVDAIATDHAPHEDLSKICEFDRAANGIIGLETALPLTLELVRGKRISLQRAIELLTSGPAAVLGLPGGTLTVGAEADVAVFDPETEWVYSLDQVNSRSHNSPWLDKTLKGKVRFTLVAGEVKYRSN